MRREEKIGDLGRERRDTEERDGYMEHGRDDERDWEDEGRDAASSGEESEGFPVISSASKPCCGLALLRRGSDANLRSAPARVNSLWAGQC
jgi:hypothetical protein